MLLVGLTRVRSLDHVRIMPLLDGHSLEHLKKLAPNRRMLCFLAGYDKQGIWHPDKTREALDKFRNPKKNQPPARAKQKPRSTPSVKPAIPAPCNTRAKRSAPEHPTARPAGQQRVSRRFLVPQLSPTLHSSFDTPEDGNCLFHAFSAATTCTQSAHALRTNLMDHIEQIADLPLRCHLLTQFFPNQEFHAHNVRHVNKQWQSYMRRMRSFDIKEWCGAYEAITLANMHNMSIVIWRPFGNTLQHVTSARCTIPQVHARLWQITSLSPFLLCHLHPSRAMAGACTSFTIRQWKSLRMDRYSSRLLPRHFRYSTLLSHFH